MFASVKILTDICTPSLDAVGVACHPFTIGMHAAPLLRWQYVVCNVANLIVLKFRASVPTLVNVDCFILALHQTWATVDRQQRSTWTRP